MKTVVLNNGVKMPAIGFGVYQIPDQKQCEQAVSDALEVGYRSIDTAEAYGNEVAVGNAIKNSGIKREDIFVTTKVFVNHVSEEGTLKAFDASLKRLGLDYLDLYLIHKPYNDYYGAWRAMERLYKEGRIRAIGVTSFWNERLQDLFLHNEIKPQVNQIETNVWYQQKEANAFMKKEGIQHEAWAPFAEGNNDVFHNPLLESIAKKHGKTVGQTMLRWLNQRNVVVIPKSVHKERMAENLNIFDFELDDDDMSKIATLDTGKSTIYDDQDLATARAIGSMKI